MTREQAKANLVACGIEEPTEEQITNYLNQVNSAVKSEKDRADKYKTEADKAAALQKKLEDLNNQGLSEVEKANKATETANARIAELEKSLKNMTIQNKLSALGITGEDAIKFFDENGELNFDILGQILSTREKNAAAAKEAELAGNAGNPGGNGRNGENSDEKTEAERFATNYAKNTAENNKVANDAMASYLNQ
ncbi:MAG: hypothetical protein IKS98_15345 [Lachnospiraceae bacterium]|nr:hypothetical protein [Lachnospiraceae bacterium]